MNGLRPDNYRFPPGLPGAVSQPLDPLAPPVPFGFDARSNVPRLSQGLRIEARQSTAARPEYATAIEQESPEPRTALLRANAGDAFELTIEQRVDGATLEWPSVSVNQVGIALPLPAGYCLVRARCTVGSVGGRGVLTGLVSFGFPCTFDYVQTFGLAVAPSIITIPPFAVSVFVEAPTGQIITVNNGITSWQAQPGNPVRVGLQGFSTLNVNANVAFSLCPLLWQVRR